MLKEQSETLASCNNEWVKALLTSELVPFPTSISNVISKITGGNGQIWSKQSKQIQHLEIQPSKHRDLFSLNFQYSNNTCMFYL